MFSLSVDVIDNIIDAKGISSAVLSDSLQLQEN